ncbi:MAG: ABC-ATPase domain-containing protein [Gammaproteobacteria bacterium]
MKSLRQKIRSIDGKGYKSYKCLKGCYRFELFSLSIDHVQGDPYAAASRISINIELGNTLIPENCFSSTTRTLATLDFLVRRIRDAISRLSKGNRGIGKSGTLFIDAGDQEIIPRNAAVISDNRIDIRMTAGLPAVGRKISGHDAEEMLLHELPLIMSSSVLFKNISATDLETHIACIEDQNQLRSWLKRNNLVAFIADDSRLPRKSGVDDRPLQNDVVPFNSPESLRYNVDLANSGPVSGMGIPSGITLITGGGYHGKSTILHALERCVYPHIPGDGREFVVTEASAVKIRAEDGRAITSTNISPFINNLPFKKDTTSFSTGNASGSTSQAANIIEAMKSGTKLLLIDEDTSATNFMIRDQRMQALVTKDKEPITPFLHKARDLYASYNISTILVMGGSGDYFEIADTVIMLDEYLPYNVTDRAIELSKPHQLTGMMQTKLRFDNTTRRIVSMDKLNVDDTNKPIKIMARDNNRLSYGKSEIDVSYVEQCIDISQLRAIGLIISYYQQNYAHRKLDINDAIELVLNDIKQSGLDIVSPYKVGDLALPRHHEIAATINRIRGIEVQLSR